MSGNGKGSGRRGGPEEGRRYADGWERIFGRRKPPPKRGRGGRRK